MALFLPQFPTLGEREGRPTTPAMAAGVADHPWSLTQLVEVLETWEAARLEA